MNLARPEELGPHLARTGAAWREIVRAVDQVAIGVFGRLEAVAREWAALQHDVLTSFGLNYAEFTTIGVLRTAPPEFRRSPTELRRLVGQSSAGMTRILAKLEDEGLVRRVGDPEDGRRLDVALTARGARLAEKSFVTLQEEQSRVLGTLRKRRWEEARIGLDALLAAFGARAKRRDTQRRRSADRQPRAVAARLA